MSSRKLLIRFFELAALAWCFGGATIAFLASVHLAAPTLFQPLVIFLFVGMFPIFGVAVILSAEFSEAIRDGQSWWQRQHELSGSELKALVRWCPRAILGPSIALIIIDSILCFIVGGVEWSSGHEFNEHHAVGFSLFSMLFCLISLPVLASASRMAGTYRSNFANLSNGGYDSK